MDDVIIIGAGAAGSMAARHLSEKKFKVTVVEARERAGGRIHTLQSEFASPVEAGAEFMHGSQPLTRVLIEQAQSDVQLLHGNRYLVRDGALKKGDVFDGQWDEFIRSLSNLEADTDIASFLRRHFGGPEYSELRENVRQFVEGFDAADPDLVSALSLRDEWSQNDDEHQYRIPQGYSSLIRYLVDQATRHGATFLFSHPVREIQWRRGEVTVLTTSGKVFKAAKALITVPLGVLQQGGLTFSPPLKQHATAFARLGYGGVVKFFFSFTEPFWEKSTRGISAFSFLFSDAPVPTWWSGPAGATSILTGWLGGPETHRINHDQEALCSKAVDSLAYIFDTTPEEIRKETAHWYIWDWVKDPFALGAYGYPTVHSKEAIRFLREPAQKTLYFAGEALYEGPAPGTVEAALVSGQEVAEKAAGDWL